MNKFSDKQYVRAAISELHEEGFLEIGDDATVSVCEEGAYVQCWRWVPNQLVALVVGSAEPVAEGECPNCHNGTIGQETAGELVCRGECGQISKRDK